MGSISNLPESMLAAVYLGPQQLELRQVPVPQPGPGEILVRVRAAVTCGTDVKIYRRGHPKFPPPFIFGHEFGGDVAAIGEGVEAYAIGQRVTANTIAECGYCFYCQHGQGNLCENLVYNFGSYAEYMVIPIPIVQRATYTIPDHLSYAEAAVVEPLSTVVHGQKLVRIQAGETVAVIGAGGPVGLMHLQMALASGAERVIAFGHSDARLAVARQLGASHVYNAHQVDTVSVIRDLTHGRGADVVIECAGTKLAWETAVEAARKGGRVLWFGGLPAGTMVELSATKIHYSEITLFGMHGATAAEARQAFELITSGSLNARCLLSNEAPLEDLEQSLLSMIAGEVIKMVIIPNR